MISKKCEDINEIKRISQNFVNSYCWHRHIPSIPVFVIKNEIMIPKELALFSVQHVCICIAPQTRDFLVRYEPRDRVWWLNNCIAHELTHYRQYLKLKRKYEVVTTNMFNEQEAKDAGKTHANVVMKYYTPETINPMKRKKSNPESLYESFHNSPPANIRKVMYENPDPKKPLVEIGKISTINYVPQSPSKKQGVEFTHKMGDDGEKIKMSNALLCTDEKGENLYIIRDNPKVKRPFFNARGIIG